MKIGIVGAGLMGLAAAQRLASRGHEVCIMEAADQVGGLTTWHDYEQFVWDRFYHVILPSDSELIAFIKDLGLESELRWRNTRTGFFVDRKFHSLDNAFEFLKFPPLSLWGKFRLGLGILYCSRINDWESLEQVPVEQFLVRLSGKETYEKIWKPLLLAKLGPNYKRVSAVFIWSYIKRLFSARDTSAQKEQLGYVRGGYKTVFRRLQEIIESAGGRIRTGVRVEKIESSGSGGVSVTSAGQVESFDKVIFTSPVNVLRQVVSADLVQIEPGKADVEYLGVICVVLVTRKPLMPYYILNIADDRVPFTGVIGMSNVVATTETAESHLTYLPKYVLSDDVALRASDEEIEEKFLAGARLLFPDFDWSSVQSVHINRAIKVQPLQVLEYSQLVPKMITKHGDFYVLNTAQFVNNTLNNNEVIRAVGKFFDLCGADLDSDIVSDHETELVSKVA